MLALVAVAWAIDPTALEDVRSTLLLHVSDPGTADALVRHLAEVADATEARLDGVGPSAGAAERVAEQVALSLAEKAARDLRLDADTLRRTVLDYEAFKLETYVTSGVFPKRYFGFLDGRADTAGQEIAVMRTTRAAVGSINALQEANGRPIRLTEVEVVVTFYAEGGALWIGRPTDLHPVFDVGLDDLAMGVDDEARAVAAIDAAAGTGLGELVAWVDAGATTLPVATRVPQHERWLKHANGDAGPFPYLVRGMTLEEAVAGTALMYLWEKERAERLLAAAGHRSLAGRSLDEQFVVSSLVYNSGLLHEPSRWKQILAFSTGAYLRERSDRNRARRPELNLLAPPEQLRELVATGEYRAQPTSWVAVYHVLQRYGAFAALRRFTDRFDADGAFTAIPSPPSPPPPLPTEAAEARPVPSGCGCGDRSGVLVLLAAVGGSRIRRRAR